MGKVRRFRVRFVVRSILLVLLVLSSPFGSVLMNLVPSVPLVPVANAQPQGEAWVGVEPEMNRYDVDVSFNVSIWAYNWSLPTFELYAWEFKLSWNASLLNFSRVFERDFLKSDGGDTLFANFTYQDEVGLDYILVNCTLVPPASGVELTFGYLADVEFTVQAKGGTPLDLYATKLFDSGGNPIKHKIYADSYFVNIAFIYATPKENVENPKVNTPDSTPGQDTFDIGIMIEEVTSLSLWSLRLKWAPPALLEVTTVQDGGFFAAEYPGDKHVFGYTIKNREGYVDIFDMINVDPLKGVSGSGSLATVTFKVKEGGNSTLTITETELFDPSISPIPHATLDAYFYTEVPCVRFTFEPSLYRPAVNSTVTFDASASYDPDGGNLTKYEWDFGDDNMASLVGNATHPPSPFIGHVYNKTGIYYVNLTVTDDEGLSWFYSGVEVSVVIRDIAITDVTLSHMGMITPGTIVNINVTVRNNPDYPTIKGATAENFNLTVYLNNTAIDTKAIKLEPPTPGRPGLEITWRLFTWNTIGLELGAYNITAWAQTSPGDYNETNNRYFWGIIFLATINKPTFTVKVFESTFYIVVETPSSLLPSPGFAFKYDAKEIQLNVTGTEGMPSYVNATIPQKLLNATPADAWKVTLNGTLCSYTLTTNQTHSFIYFEYTFSSTYRINITGNWVNQPPQASYTYNATKVGTLYAIAIWQKLTLNATDSYDPDDPGGTLTSYFWDIIIRIPATGEIRKIWSHTTTNPIITLSFNETAIHYPYKIILTVTDKDGLKNSTYKEVNVKEHAHDLEVDVRRVPPEPEIVDGTIVNVILVIKNYGTNNETFDASLRYGTTFIGSKTGVSLEAKADVSFTQKDVSFLWDTTGLPEGEYWLIADVSVANDEKPDNNQWSGRIIIKRPTQPTKIFLQPPKIVDTTMTLGKQFTINVNVSSIGDPKFMAPLYSVYSWEVKIKWDPTIIEYVSATEGEFLKRGAGPFGLETFWVEPDVNQTAGYLTLGCTIKGAIDVGHTRYREWVEALFGNGTLTSVTFKVKGIGETYLDLYDTKLRNPVLGVVLHDAEDGYFRNLASIKVEPSSIDDPSLLPGKSFNININITIADVTDLYSWEFKMNWNPLVLNITEIKEGTFLAGQPGGTAFTIKELNRAEGYIIVNCFTVGNYPGVSGSGVLANITFSVVGKGESIIDLSDTKLLNSTSNQIEHVIQDGYFKNVILPKAKFTYTPSSPKVGDIVSFDASPSQDPKGGRIVKYYFDLGDGTNVTGTPSYDSDGRLISCSWVFGNGTTIVTTNVVISYRFSVAETYKVSLIVTDNSTLKGSITEEITISKISTSLTIGVNPKTVTVGSNITISGTIKPTLADVNITIYYRLLGGSWKMLAALKTDAEGKHAYIWKTTQMGTYEVKANWQGDYKHISAESPILSVTVTGIYNLSITNATLSATNIIIGSLVNVNVTIENKGHFTENFNVTLYYNDTVATTTINVTLASGANTTLNIIWNTSNIAPGTYTLKAKVPSVFGEENTVDNEYIIGEVTARMPKPPVASFTYSPERPLVDHPITFNASASKDEDGQIVSYFWDFGDGANATNVIPIATHSYNKAGTYTVSLTVTDNDGLTHKITATIRVENVPETNNLFYIGIGIGIAALVIIIAIFLIRTRKKTS
jgi:PKD repeat protein